jgi:hypothetical protein
MVPFFSNKTCILHFLLLLIVDNAAFNCFLSSSMWLPWSELAPVDEGDYSPIVQSLFAAIRWKRVMKGQCIRRKSSIVV